MSNEWSKDYVEHIRAVHFALAVASLGLIIVVTGNRRSEVQIAHEQVSQIIDTLPALRCDLIEQEAIDFMRRSGRQITAPRMKRFFELPVGPKTIPFELVFTGEEASSAVPLGRAGLGPGLSTGFNTNWLVKVSGIEKNHPPLSPDEEQVLRLFPMIGTPETLQEFKYLWNLLQSHVSILIPEVINSDASVTVTNAWPPPAEVFKITPFADLKVPMPLHEKKELHSKDAPTKIELSLEWIPEGIEPSAPAFPSRFCGNTPGPNQVNIHVCVPISGPSDSVETIPLQALSPLIDRRPAWDWHNEAFATAFRELDSVTKEYSDVKFKTMEKILAAEERRAGESFEILGMKIPADQTVYWGIFVIMALQFYFWVHLRELNRRLKPTDLSADVAWIGLYPTQVARALVFVSAIIIPILATVLLSVRGAQSISQLWLSRLLFLPILPSLLISYLCFAALPYPITGNLLTNRE